MINHAFKIDPLLSILTLIACCIICGTASGQDSLHPSFTTFHGNVYLLPFDSLPKGYRPYVEQLTPKKTIEWDEISIWESTSKVPFPDVKYRDLFGIVFTSIMEVPEDGDYEFILVSDDGSKLWIEDNVVLDNDKPHPMSIKRDTITLNRGKYPIKIWYYQAYPNRYGIIFKANYIQKPSAPVVESFEWSGDILFGFDNYQLSESGEMILDSLLEVLESKEIQKIEIIGHTDNIGPEDYNLDLSAKRAESIKTYFEQSQLLSKVQIITVGKGEQIPVVDNSTAQNRSLNRRVEVIFQ